MGLAVEVAILVAAFIVFLFTLLMSIGLFAHTVHVMQDRERSQPHYVSYVSLDEVTKDMPVSERIGSCIRIHNLVCYPHGMLDVSELLVKLSEENQTEFVFINSVLPIMVEHAKKLELTGIPAVHLIPSAHLVKDHPCT
jgi:hypothetical protein